MVLSAGRNVWDSCLSALLSRGYDVVVLPADPESTDLDVWHASRQGFVFGAESPIELLGLTALRAELQPVKDSSSWWSPPSGTRGLVERLVRNGEECRDARERDLSALKVSNPTLWRRTIFDAFAEVGADDIANAAHILRISRAELRRIVAEGDL